MSRIIALANQKGGVGKTTSAVSIASELAQKGHKTLLVDVDPQGNATSGVGVDKRKLEYSVYNVLIEDIAVTNAIVKTKYDNLYVLPSNIDLAGAELELIDIEHREYTLKRALTAVKDEFDFIIIDAPPSLGLITTGVLSAADSVIIPLQCEYYALEGLSQLMNTIRKVKRAYNKYLDIEGVLLTMYDKRLRLSQQVVSEVKKYFPKKLYKTVIPRSVKLSEAPSFGEPINYYDKGSKGEIAYSQLADEIIKNNS